MTLRRSDPLRLETLLRIAPKRKNRLSQDADANLKLGGVRRCLVFSPALSSARPIPVSVKQISACERGENTQCGSAAGLESAIAGLVSLQA